jgi:hypothetical protein
MVDKGSSLPGTGDEHHLTEKSLAFGFKQTSTSHVSCRYADSLQLADSLALQVQNT